ncbi:NnrU family protein [Parerythrobacter aestuarii]|uniref:NnrU family protein n=1 Tax=Parerythrobacter aestuarii TaxID=3020909 RepID=UPI0024DE08B2|nr:NnrU family protein [Parerythrobacter aestuarii]
MSTELASLIAASATFVGTHFLMSHPLRAAMVKALGANGFQIAYSVVSFGAIGWMYFAFKAAPVTTPLWTGFDDASWAVASVLTLLAMVLLAGSFVGNPALSAPGAEQAALKEPHGAFRITRHPMMWGFALWALAHAIAAPTARTLVVTIALAILALVGARLQDGKKEVLMGEAWAAWESKTSYWPKLGNIGAIGWKTWAIGTVIWLAASWAHIHPSGWAAGVWRWL